MRKIDEIEIKEEVRIGDIILEKGDKIRVLSEIQSLGQMLGIVRSGHFNGCEIAVTLSPLTKDTFVYKESNFIRVIDFLSTKFFLYCKIQEVDRDVFTDAHNTLMDYQKYEEESSDFSFGEGKWNIDEDSVFFPYPGFSEGWGYKLPKEVCKFMDDNFSNNFIEKNLGRKDY